MASRYDLVVVGMGSAGLVAAEFAAGLGLSVVAVERDRVGGDCLWTGCVPSKALLAAGKVAHHMRTADRFGIRPVDPDVDLAAVWRRMRSVQERIATTDDDPSRFEEMGVEVLHGPATLDSATTVRVGDRTLETRFILLCTGSRPAKPSIPGLEQVGYLTSENLFALEEPPRSLVCVGGGPIAVEMAQALQRLGIAVTLLQRGHRLLPRDEPVLADRVADLLRAEGVMVQLDADAVRVEREKGAKVVVGRSDGAEQRWVADDVLVATGRRPDTEGLGLDGSAIGTGERGIEVDDRGRTSVRSVYACGDVVGRYRFTHSAAYEGVRAVRDMFLPGTGKVKAVIPWCTFTDPELAHVGMTESEARARYGGGVEIWRRELEHNDRARTDDATAGAVILVTHKRRIIGAHALAPAAGELINELALAISGRLKIDALAGVVHVYPTASTALSELGGDAARRRAEKLRWLVRR